MVLYTEEQLKKSWINYLLDLKQLEEEHDFDLGPYPDLEEFRVIYEEEMSSNT